MQLQEIKLIKNFAPHLRGNSPLALQEFRALLSTTVLFCAAVLVAGNLWLQAAGVIIASAVIAQFFLQAVKTEGSSSPVTLLRQILLLTLFIPANISLPEAAFAAALLTLVHRLCGGRAGMVVQPVCFALAVLYGVTGGHFRPEFILSDAGVFISGILVLIWALIRFPNTQIETERILIVLLLAVELALLHEIHISYAVLWGLAAGDLILDAALPPLSPRGRLRHQLIVAGIFSLLVASGERADAMTVTGLISGFLAAWIEKQTVKGTR